MIHRYFLYTKSYLSKGRLLTMSVFLAFNGRPASQRALDFAINYSKMSKLPLYIYTFLVSNDIVENEERLAEVKNCMKEAEELAKKEGIDVHLVVEPGPSAENILAAATRFNSDIIVVGRSDKTFIDRVVLGSVSQYVVDHAKCNVVVVH